MYIFFCIVWVYSSIFVIFAADKTSTTMNKWIRRKRNSWGYGVQSPSDFYFVQHVLREKSPYYGYSEIEELKEKHSAHLPLYSEGINKLLFRLANYTQAKSIIEVGAGLSTYAMTLGRPSARCIAITSSEPCKRAMQSLLNEHPQVEIKEGDEMDIFCNLIQELGTIGLLHVAHTDHYREVIDAALPHVTDQSLIVIEDICSSKEKYDWWEELQKSSQTGITYDLGNIGLLFFNSSRHKNNYWINIRK